MKSPAMRRQDKLTARAFTSKPQRERTVFVNASGTTCLTYWEAVCADHGRCQHAGWTTSEYGFQTHLEDGTTALCVAGIWHDHPAAPLPFDEPTTAPQGIAPSACQHCAGTIIRAHTGRPARFCSTRCRVAAHRATNRS